MKKIIFQSAVGAIMLLLSDKLQDLKTAKHGSFVTENETLFFRINFRYEDILFTIEIQNEKTENMLIFVNGNEVCDCINIEKALEEVKSKIK